MDDVVVAPGAHGGSMSLEETSVTELQEKLKDLVDSCTATR